MFSKEVIDAVIAAAKENGWPASALLAIVECETSGKPFEDDGVTPSLLFERHKFYSELKVHAPEKLSKAVAAGLAIPKWTPKDASRGIKGQYFDEGSSQGRLALIAKARAIDEDVANRATSWGLGQTMGFNAERLGYATATDMVRELSAGGIDAQVNALVREIKTAKLDKFLKTKDFTSFARVYNGSGFRKNNYDGKMRLAEERWARRIANKDLSPTPGDAETRAIQSRLKELGYPVGAIDGKFGDLTSGALAAFQRRYGLKVTGNINQETREQLDKASPREVDDARSEATVGDLRDKGSQIVASADKGSVVSKVLVGVGAAGGAQSTGLLDQAQEFAGKIDTAKGVFDSIKGFVDALTPYWWVGAIIVGAVTWQLYGDIIKQRLRDHQLGEHLGI